MQWVVVMTAPWHGVCSARPPEVHAMRRTFILVGTLLLLLAAAPAVRRAIGESVAEYIARTAEILERTAELVNDSESTDGAARADRGAGLCTASRCSTRRRVGPAWRSPPRAGPGRRPSTPPSSPARRAATKSAPGFASTATASSTISCSTARARPATSSRYASSTNRSSRRSAPVTSSARGTSRWP